MPKKVLARELESGHLYTTYKDRSEGYADVWVYLGKATEYKMGKYVWLHIGNIVAVSHWTELFDLINHKLNSSSDIIVIENKHKEVYELMYYPWGTTFDLFKNRHLMTERNKHLIWSYLQ